MEGHTAFVHTAASSLGIMLNKVCIKRSRGHDQGVRVLTIKGSEYLIPPTAVVTQ